MALGLLLSIPFIPSINRRIGVGRSTKIGVLLLAILFNSLLLAPSYVLLCVSLFIVGLLSGFTDVSMNALISTIEKRESIHIMSSAHGFFSLGGFLGAGIGSILISFLASPAIHMLLISTVILISNAYLSSHYQGVKEEVVVKDKSQSNFTVIRPLIALSVLAFIVMINEGAVEHWSNLFLFDVVKVSESRAGLGFIAFSLFMTIGRFLGDGISKRIGPINIISGGAFIGFLGYLLILTSNFYISVIGFGILGLGLSVVIPELFRLAGNTKGVPPSVGISIVSGIGFAGFLTGPVLLGLISNKAGLSASYIFLAFSIILALILVFLRLKNKYKGVNS